MDVIREKISRTKKKLICRLNDLCFGMHGHLTFFLKNLHYFFYFKKRYEYEIANLYLECAFFQLRQIIVLSRLIEGLGGYPEILAYKNNQVGYYRIKNGCKVTYKVAILDSLSNQILSLKEYVKIKKETSDKKIKERIEIEIENLKTNIRNLREKVGLKTAILPNL